MNAAKNFAVSPAAGDLGLGDILNLQAEDEINARKKKLGQLTGRPADYGAIAMGSPAVMSLGLGLGNGGV